ncbi:hypothetical protein BDB01DRAFT_802163 [Pilobolus umbonatus]|nr:hypothetical protein BDB01DRAFT_802163 [Pilobolus umbonatus]
MSTNDTPLGPAYQRSSFAMDPENLESEMSKIPLFMTDLPSEENDTLAAIQSLIFDGTPEEVAQNFREQGNDCFRAGKSKYKDAIAFYTKAIETECPDQSIIEACLANRAACHLELGNYGRVLNDCSQCLKINPKNIKALYRSSRALFSLDRLVETIDCCQHALSIDPENKPIKDILTKATERKELIDEKIRKQQEREERERMKKETLEKAFKERHITIEVENAEVREKANIEFDHETNTINWPVFFLYPEHKESDYIQAFNETNTFQDHLEIIGLNPKLIKIGKKLPLGKILSLDQYVIKNGVPSFIIMPKNCSFKQKFLSQYKK